MGKDVDGLSLGKVNILKKVVDVCMSVCACVCIYIYIRVFAMAALLIFMFGIFHNKLLGKEYGQIILNSSPAFGKYQLCSFGEGNGTPLQYSCLENPMDGEAG